MVTKFIEYNISLKEIDRRKKYLLRLLLASGFG